MSTVIVTGAAGALGSSVCRLLAGAGFEVVGLDRVANATVPILHWVVGDICVAGWDDLLHDASAVVHAAAFVHRFVDSPEDEKECFRVNHDCTMSLGKACASAKVPLLFVSTIAVYGDSPSRLPITELSSGAPATPYGASKLAAERGLRQIASQGLRFTILQFPLLFGPGCHGNMEKMLSAIRHKRFWPIDSNAKKSCLFVEDAAHAILTVIRCNSWRNEVYVVAPPEAITVAELERLAYKVIGRWYPPPISVGLARTLFSQIDDVARLLKVRSRLSDSLESLIQPSWCCGGKFSQQFGFRPGTDIREGLLVTAKQV
jgi:nucleoside-diphosphate-sugar epimerase